MAIDTKTKRLSMINFGSISTDTLPEPDASIDEGGRLHLLDLFSGNADAPTAAAHHRHAWPGGFSGQR